MSLTPQHQLLCNLLDYVVEQSKEIDPHAFKVANGSDFRRYQTELAGLPGVNFDLKVTGDHIWLQVDRLETTTPPRLADDAARAFVFVDGDPNGSGPRLSDAALQHQFTVDVRSDGLVVATAKDTQRRNHAATALDHYLPDWQAWAAAERPRRQTITLYGDLFALKGRLEAQETVRPSELVWGIGLSSWIFRNQAEGRAGSVEFSYPLLTQAMEVELNDQTHSLAVRPRAMDPRLEFDAFGACQVFGATETEQSAKRLLSRQDDHPLSPFDVGSFEAVLKLVAGTMCETGQYDPSSTKPRTASTHLHVTPGWILLARPRAANFLVEDIVRLKERLQSGVAIPAGPLELVTEPSEEPARYDPVSFRGLCSSRTFDVQPKELFFPLPYNPEQETIVEMLERAPGVTVQGPPGTGKTHTIANIICHYVATGRKVLVTSKGEHALEVLQSKIPDEVRPLTVALLAGDKEGMRQFQTSIETIIHNLSQHNAAAVAAEIQDARRRLDAAHNELASLDARVDEIASSQLASVEIDGVAMRAQDMAELAVSGHELHSWFDDVLSLESSHAPPLTAEDAQQLRESRRKLGPDLVYLKATLPSSSSLPAVSDVASLHETLVGIRQIVDREQSGALPPLRLPIAECLQEVRRFLDTINTALPLVRELETLNAPWVFELRQKSASKPFQSEIAALQSLFAEVDGLVSARAEYLKHPVTISAKALADAQIKAAVQRAADSGKPFGLFSLSGSAAKEEVGKIRHTGIVPTTVDTWRHVLNYIELNERVLAFSVRWSQVADLLSIPPISGGVLQLREIEQVALAARKAHELSTVNDTQVLALAEQLFADHSALELTAGSERLEECRGHVVTHLRKHDLAAAAVGISVLHEKLAGSSGPVSDDLRRFADETLGNSEVPAARVAAAYASLLAEVRRVEALARYFAKVAEHTDSCERAGAPKFANRLRDQLVDASGDDAVLPTSWRDAWNWSRIRNHVERIDGRAELLKLAARRRELERILASQYLRLVSKSAWQSTKSNASPKVLSALETYRTAIRKIGQGTGTNATRHRRDAQKAMLDAQGAIPCWIMSHAKVSESMPPELGAFDLVIVDEASQSNLWALPAVLRGAKILVVGDDKQVSPEGGFISAAKIQTLRDRFLQGQAYPAVLTPEKSLYDLSSTVFAAQKVTLREHFRCVEPIISYSNKVFYDGFIQPLRLPKLSERLDPPLVDIYAPGGVRSAKDTNTAEAEAVVGEIASILRNPAMGRRTIGVVSLLGPEQAQFIDSLVRSRCDANELHKRRFESGDARVFQGSERDIMFLSMVADRNDHKALSGNMFEQRFNVAASRARDRMYLVRSLKLAELSPRDLRRTLLEHFSKPLDGPADSSNADNLCESEFERDVYNELVGRGYRVVPQVKAGSFRIDMVVEGGNDSRLAIECDGDAFHGPDRWRDDMGRQRILERAGWMFWRCFASTWRIKRTEVLADLLGRLQALGIDPTAALDRTPMLVEYREWAPVPQDLLGDAL